MMVGDTEDRKRWERVREFQRAAAKLEAKAIDKHTPQWQRAELMEQSRAMYRHAHALVV
jgi:hypothetical protein